MDNCDLALKCGSYIGCQGLYIKYAVVSIIEQSDFPYTNMINLLQCRSCIQNHNVYPDNTLILSLFP